MTSNRERAERMLGIWGNKYSYMVEELAGAFAEVERETLGRAAEIADHISDCDLRCMNDCKNAIADAIRQATSTTPKVTKDE